jgi:uncharacterized repeat protein (TIGR03803 family)
MRLALIPPYEVAPPMDPGKRARKRRFSCALALAILLGGLALAPFAPAQTFTLLHTFPNPGYPSGTISYVAGTLYGTTVYGGRGFGTVFRMDLSGNETVLYVFNGALDGEYPSDVVSDGTNLYGTTEEGGLFGKGLGGTVFKVDTATDKKTVLYNFPGGNDGAFPTTGVILDAAANLYGTTLVGPTGNGGTVFKLDQAGNETVLYGFPDATDGVFPESSLIRDASGNLYGATLRGGDLNCNHGSGCGTVFKLDAAGNETVLYSFTGEDGNNPKAALMLDAAGNLYGTTTIGGAFNQGAVFKLGPNGNETVLHSFTGAADGSDPSAGLIQDAAGNLYGTAALGGVSNSGTVFKVDTAGRFTVLHSFSGMVDGANPFGGLVLDGKGNLYGTAQRGGAFNNGTVFKITP